VFEAQPVTPKMAGHGFYTVDGGGRGRGVRSACECGWMSLRAHNGGLAGATWDVHIRELMDGIATFDHVTVIADSLIPPVAACGTAAREVLDAGLSLPDVERERLIVDIRTNADGTIGRFRDLISGGDGDGVRGTAETSDESKGTRPRPPDLGRVPNSSYP